MNNIDVPAGKYCKSMIENACEFVHDMFDMSDAELKEYVAANSNNDFVYIEFTYKELDRDEKWFEEQKRALNNNALKIKRELLLQWTKSFDTSVFSEEDIDSLEQYIVHESNTIRVPDTNFSFKLLPGFDLRKSYVLGIDVAGGLNKDFSTVVAVDPITFKPEAVFRNNKIDVNTFQKFVERSAQLLFPHSVLAIERSPITLGMISYLLNDADHSVSSRLVYMTNKDDTVEKEEKNKKFKKGLNKSHNESEGDKVYGIKAVQPVRDYMIELLQYEVTNNPSVFVSKDLIGEIATLELSRRGKVEHASGCHDDVLFGYLMARFAIAKVPSTHVLLRANKVMIFTNTDGVVSEQNISKSNLSFNKFSKIIDSTANSVATNMTLDFLQSLPVNDTSGKSSNNFKAVTSKFSSILNGN